MLAGRARRARDRRRNPSRTRAAVAGQGTLHGSAYDSERALVRRRRVTDGFREVADGLAARGTYDDQVASLERNVEASQRFLDLAQQRFQIGVDSYLIVLTAQT